MDTNPLSPQKISSTWVIAACLFLSIATLLVYYPGLSGDFEFDDTVNILQNHVTDIDELTLKNLYQASMVGGIAGKLKRPISVATIVINRFLTGLDPFYMKLTNIAIHAINSLGVLLLSFLLIRAFFESASENISVKKCQWLALAITAVWTLHPLALTSNLYIIQRMTSMSALFSIFGLISFVVARRQMIKGQSGMVLLASGFIVFGLASVFSKENGALLPLLMLVIECTLFKFNTFTQVQKRFLYGFFILTVAVPAILTTGILFFSPDSLMGGYNNRSFDVFERVLTEARVIWFYISMILLPDISQMGIYHDDIVISQGLLTPWSTLPSLAGILILIFIAVKTRKTLPALSFGVLFFFAGHSLESTILPLEIAHEHRNYLPMFGIIFSVVFYLTSPLLHPESLKARNFITIVFIALLALTTSIRATYWGSLLEHSIMESSNHPASASAQYQTSRVYWKLAIANPENQDAFFLKAREHFELTSKLPTGKNKGLIALIHLGSFTGSGIEQHWLDELLYELENSPVPADTPAMLHTLTLCQVNNFCRLTYAQMQLIFNAALSNTNLKGNSRAAILTSAGVFREKHDGLNEAIGYFYAAAESAINRPAYRLILIDLLIALNHIEDAKHHIELIKIEDKFKSYTQEIAIREESLLKN